MIEHLFDSVNRGDPEVPPRDDPKIASRRAKQNPGLRRLTVVKRSHAGLVTATLRIGFMVGLAALLILVLLPAAVAAQAAGLR